MDKSLQPNEYAYGSLDHSRLGQIVIVVGSAGLVALETDIPDVEEFCLQKAFQFRGPLIENPYHTDPILNRLQAYFSGERLEFDDIPIDVHRYTPFQQAVFHRTHQIPYGQVYSYGEVAQQVGAPRAARAVGQAMSICPISIIIPCHRVIAANNKLGGYGSRDAWQRKSWLLALEGRLFEP